MPRSTQNRRVLGYMRLHKSITPLTALSRLGVMRLGARIWELKRDGHSIQSSIIKGRGKRYAKYTLVQPYRFDLELNAIARSYLNKDFCSKKLFRNRSGKITLAN